MYFGIALSASTCKAAFYICKNKVHEKTYDAYKSLGPLCFGTDPNTSISAGGTVSLVAN